MLAWAADTDQRIAAGELPPLGSGQLKAGEKAQLLSDQERAQVGVGLVCARVVARESR